MYNLHILLLPENQIDRRIYRNVSIVQNYENINKWKLYFLSKPKMALNVEFLLESCFERIPPEKLAIELNICISLTN